MVHRWSIAISLMDLPDGPLHSIHLETRMWQDKQIVRAHSQVLCKRHLGAANAMRLSLKSTPGRPELVDLFWRRWGRCYLWHRPRFSTQRLCYGRHDKRRVHANSNDESVSGN